MLASGKNPYLINLDPAVLDLPYEPNIDIRDTIDYKQVMTEYKLGPNGAIVTSLNLFTTKFDQVLGMLEEKENDVDECPSHIIVDTPGQIEIFTWSASGSIITESIAAMYPTVVAYIIDTERCKSPATFMSNMLYACSIMYKTKLPFVVVLNKTDVEPCDFILDWMQDFTLFQAALQNDETYMASLVHSMSLVLEEFYSELNVVGVSSLLGDGIDSFIEALAVAVNEYESEYRPEFERLHALRKAEEDSKKQANLEKLVGDLDINN